MTIAFLSSDYGHGPNGRRVPGGSGWARVHQPALWLSRAHTVGVGPVFSSSPSGRLCPLTFRDPAKESLDPRDLAPVIVDADIAVVQRWTAHHAADAIRAARSAGQVVVNDVDDDYWSIDPRNLAYAHNDPRLNPEANRVHYRAAVEASTAVTVSTAFLGRRLRQRFGVRTILLRNAVDPMAFATQQVRPVDTGLVVGWVGALGWRSGDLETMAGWLPDFLAEVDGTFVHHGVMSRDIDTAAARSGVPPRRIGPSRGFTTPAEYPTLLSGFDIGVVPLTDQPFNRAKSWIKGLEMAAAGIPFVAQATEEYRALEALGAGVTASTPGEWHQAMTRLRDPAYREHLRMSGLHAAYGQSWQVRWREWQDAYEGLLQEA